MLSAFVDELAKIASAHGRMHVPKAREGRRPISVSTLLEKDKKGTLFKRADSQGNPQDVRGDSVDDPGAARPPRRRGEVPSEGTGNIPVGEKTGGKLAYRLADTTQPFTSGEEPTISPETRKPRQPGDVPTQTTQEAMIAPPSGGGISFGQAKGEALRGRKKGDVPTRDRDINIVDKHDQRDNATTVHGLGQHSTDIAASNIAAEHT